MTIINKHNKIEVGDRVIVNGKYHDNFYNNLIGTVVCTSKRDIAIEFDDKIPNGIKCCGYSKRNNGMCFNGYNNLQNIEFTFINDTIIDF